MVFKTYEAILIEKGMKGFFILMLCLVIFWHIYTPIHELLHVLGCWITGGEVTELALKPQYGAHLLKKIFPFIVADSDYAGQLTGFSVPNDLAYMVVDFLPYVLSIPGMALFVWAYQRKSAVLFGIATILGLIPIFAIPGDFFEAASLLTSRLASVLDSSLAPRDLVSDDVFKLIGSLGESGFLRPVPVLSVTLGVMLAIAYCVLCFALQLWCAGKWLGREAIEEILEFRHLPPKPQKEVNEASEN